MKKQKGLLITERQLWDLKTYINEQNLNEIDWEDKFKDVQQKCMNIKMVVDYLNKVRANAPLHHLKSVFKGMKNQALKNKLVMIKLSDRVDNLNKRGLGVNKNYINKSIELIQFLKRNYTGSINLNKILLFLHKKLKKKIKV